MNKIHAVIVLGIVVALTPYLGIPASWKTFLNVVLGLVISLLSYLWIKKYHYYSAPSDFSSGGLAKESEEIQSEPITDYSEEALN